MIRFAPSSRCMTKQKLGQSKGHVLCQAVAGQVKHLASEDCINRTRPTLPQNRTLTAKHCVLQQQHCLRNHWFKKLSPSDSRATQKYIHKMRAFKTRNPGYPGLGVPISYFALSHFCLRWNSSHKKGNQETKGVDFVFQSSAPNPYKGNKEMRTQKDSSPQHFPFQLMCLSTRAWHPSDSLNAIISIPFFPKLVIRPYQKPPKITNRAPQFLKLKKTSPSISYLGGFVLYAKVYFKPLLSPDKASKALQSCCGKPRTNQK